MLTFPGLQGQASTPTVPSASSSRDPEVAKLIQKYGAPSAPKVSVAPSYAPPTSMTEAEQRVPTTPEAPTQGNDWSMEKLFKPTKAIGNFLSSSEQKAGKIIGDSLAGVEDQAAQNDANERTMQAKIQHQIALNRQEGKDTSHLEWALSKAMQNFKGAEQQIAEQAPGSLATNEEAAGAVAAVLSC